MDADIEVAEIERALADGELLFFYQPKVSLHTGALAGAEALLRWIRPDGMVIPPGRFLPLAESTGLITEITEAMLPRLIEDIEALKRVNPLIQVAFNVSARDLKTPRLLDALRSYIESPRIGPGNIQIEITETVVVEDDARIRRMLNEIVEMGVELAMDDYGTGYSSLDLLSRFPFSTLKMDHGVIRRMAKDAKNTHIVRASLTMARELSIKTVAEGIESEPVYTFLAASGCVEGQGFWMSPPLPRARFAALMQEDRHWPSCTLGLLNDALSRHLYYRRKVIDLVYTLLRSRPEERALLPRMDLVHNAARCRLDRFFLDDGGGPDSPSGALDLVHREMHRLGHDLVRAVDDMDDRDRVVELLQAFMDASGEVDTRAGQVIRDRLAGTVVEDLYDMLSSDRPSIMPGSRPQ